MILTRIAVLTAALCVCESTFTRESSEIELQRTSIVPEFPEKPIPQGIVDVNPPWLHIYVPLLDGTEKNNTESRKKKQALKWHRRFYFRLSQDKSFEGDVLKSGPRRWSFWNPLKPLQKGTWYWAYGLASPETPDKPVWSQTFSFEIRGSEWMAPIQPPSAEQIVDAVRTARGPITLVKQEEIGKILPWDSDPEIAKALTATVEKALEKDAPIEFKMSEKDLPPGIRPNRAFFAVRLRSLWVQGERHVAALLRGYLLTGENRYLTRGIERAIELEQARLSVEFKIADFSVALRDIAIYDSVANILADGFLEHMPPDKRDVFVRLIMETMEGKSDARNKLDGPKLHEYLEHVHYDQHDWQFKAQDLLLGSMILLRHNPEMEDWVKYAYELWLYRNPAMSRHDGATREGIGYLGVHENHLVHTPWVLYRLTGYNYYRYKPWFQNISKHLSYKNPVGNPGQAFSDGGNDGAKMPYLAEMLARMCPENEWNLWRLKTLEQPSPSVFAADVFKNSKAWDVMTMRKQFKAPDLSQVMPPKEMAAVFRDVGIAVFHTSLAEPSRNMLVNFRSSPYGSSTHGHPCQNAFNIAYGNETLFWRTGYYNGGGDHNILSYKSSRAHNTIIPNGIMQGFDVSAYGWLTRFAHGDRISYVQGDASHAYNGVHRYVKAPDQKYGVDDAGVTRFRRHVVMLRPYGLVVYDELQARTAIPWTFRLHSLYEMKTIDGTAILGRNANAHGVARIFCNSDLASELTDKFDGTPVDEENKRGGQNPPHWHWSVTTKDKLAATRFLTVIQITPEQDPQANQAAWKVRDADGNRVISIGDYRITASLDPAKPSFLHIESSDGQAVLSTGQASEKVERGGVVRKARLPGSTLLWETSKAKGEVFIEEADEVPDVLKYGNPY